MEIRPMHPTDDRFAISRIYEEGWKYAYKGIVPQAYLDSIPTGQWASKLDQEGVGSLVAVADGKLIGTTSYCKSRWADFGESGEIISIYFLPQYMGRGYGRELLYAAVGELEKLGFEDIFLWVLEENGRARRFYGRCGFVPTEYDMWHEIGGKALREIQYRYSAGTSPILSDKGV
ncbi:MAG: GNAT family N-acetyltransferase [Lachnospiraceae bacterium]|nr:GNAT family N-acetyltransferase [Lachnospiraceae bacterium]